MRLTARDFEILRFLDFRRPLTEYPGMMKPTTRFGFSNYIQDGREVETVLRYFYTRWDEVADGFSWRVDLMSENFCNEEEAARDALEGFLDGARRIEVFAGQTLQGTMIVPHLRMSLSYIIPFDAQGNMDVNRSFLLQLSERNTVSLALFPNGNGGRQAFISETMRAVKLVNGEERELDAMDDKLNYLEIILSMVKLHHLFLRFANVKQKIIAREGTREARKAAPGDYVSELTFPVRQLNATYFTTTTHIGEFLRRGHFRMQRYKNNGEWDHKLIWIDQTTVSGYTRKAKVLIAPENDIEPETEKI